MAAKSKAQKVLPPVGNSISNCNFEIVNSANEFTHGAVVALANAAEANARAIMAAAQALNSSSNNTTAVSIGN